MPSTKEAGALRALKHLDLEATRPKKNTPTPLGTLSILPRELRDQVYRQLCGQEYRFFNEEVAPHSKWLSDDDTSNHDAKLPMLKFSKTIRQEFLAVLLAEAVFIIEDLGWYACYPWVRDDIPFINRIQNVQMDILIDVESEEDYDECDEEFPMYDEEGRLVNGELSQKSVEPTSFFTGTDFPRKTCIINLDVCTPKTILMIQSPLFITLKQLTNFEIITLELSSPEELWSPEDALTYIGKDISCTNHAAGLGVLGDAMRSALEPSLGPNIISVVEETRKTPRCCRITFHPQDYLSQKKKNLEAGPDAQVEDRADAMAMFESN